MDARLQTESSPGADVQSQAPRVLLLEDDATLADLFERSLCRRGCRVDRFSRAEEVDQATDAGLAGILVSDMWLAGSMNGLQLVKRLRARGDRRPAVLISGTCDGQVEQAALAAGASRFLLKPFSLKELGNVVERMFHPSPAARPSAPSTL